MLGSSAADSWYVVVGIGASSLAILESLRRVLRGLWRASVRFVRFVKRFVAAVHIMLTLGDLPRLLKEHSDDDATFQQLILRRLDGQQPKAP